MPCWMHSPLHSLQVFCHAEDWIVNLHQFALDFSFCESQWPAMCAMCSWFAVFELDNGSARVGGGACHAQRLVGLLLGDFSITLCTFVDAWNECRCPSKYVNWDQFAHVCAAHAVQQVWNRSRSFSFHRHRTSRQFQACLKFCNHHISSYHVYNIYIIIYNIHIHIEIYVTIHTHTHNIYIYMYIHIHTHNIYI
jgi:hypothetical protein